MENQNQPTSEGMTPTHNNEALRILASCLSQAFEHNREWRRFASGLPDERACQEAELAELKRAEAWLASLPESVAIVSEDDRNKSLFKPDLSRVSAEYLAAELTRRERAGECVALVITPDDLASYWECDDAGSTSPASRIPEAAEMRAISLGFIRWLDCGNFTEIMEVCRDYWQAEQARQLDSQEGKGESK